MTFFLIQRFQFSLCRKSIYKAEDSSKRWIKTKKNQHPNRWLRAFFLFRNSVFCLENWTICLARLFFLSLNYFPCQVRFLFNSLRCRNFDNEHIRFCFVPMIQYFCLFKHIFIYLCITIFYIYLWSYQSFIYTRMYTFTDIQYLSMVPWPSRGFGG